MPKKKQSQKAALKERVEVNCASDAALERAMAIAEAKRLETLPAHERLKAYAEERKHVADSLLRVNFPSLKDIKHVRGLIVVVADDQAAMRVALEEARGALGDAASPQELMDYAEKHKVKTTFMSIRVFKRNLMNVLRMCNGNSEIFGAGSGGGQLKDIYQAGKAAIQEAEAYWNAHNTGMSKEVKDFMSVGSTTDETMFTKLAGENWREEAGLDADTKKLLGFV